MHLIAGLLALRFFTNDDCSYTFRLKTDLFVCSIDLICCAATTVFTVLQIFLIVLLS